MATPISRRRSRRDDRDALERIFNSLKQFQVAAIREIEKRKNVIVVQKTSSDKSLCYQLPAQFEKGKTTVVIRPTISLINSQIEGLQRLKIKAVAVGPHFGTDATVLYEDELPALLYTTPEFFKNILKHGLSSDKLKLIVIDEAHKVFDRNNCFRTFYDSLSGLQEELPVVPIMALTATLDEEQLQSLSSHYLKKPVLIRDSVNSPNIKLNVTRYTAKRPVKEGRNLVWMDVANEIHRIVGEDYAIVYIYIYLY